MYKLIFYVPETHLTQVKQALFDAGAGRFEGYDQCCWQILGQGQFRALEGSDPHLGKVGEVETVAEYNVEMICGDDCINAVIAALKASHPYEEPAFQYWPVSVA